MVSHGAINASVCCLYREPSYNSEIVSQGLLGEEVELIEHGELFSRIRQEDGYESWISSDQVSSLILPQRDRYWLRSHFVAIYAEPATGSDRIRDAVIGSALTVTGERGEWYSVILPDGLTGWIEKQHFAELAPFTPESIVNLAREFLGYQYIWGGRSPKGFDCSGFVQTVFRLHGILLPRDSHQQQLNHLVSNDYRDARPADLVFFGKTPEKVTHVAISLGNQRFIHASGWVRYNSFNTADSDFSQRHVERCISVNRYRS
jgi:cell wall-associated NlpC family hydrolase